jgi:hypothetical protein
MTDSPNDLLIEQAASACRERDTWGRILPSSSWWDLSPENRDAVFERQMESRIIEGALHPRGLSTTVRAVLSRLR